MPQPRHNKPLATTVSIALCGALLSMPAISYADAPDTNQPTPAAATAVAETDAATQAKQLMDLIDNPFADNLGYTFRTELDSPAKITQLQAQIRTTITDSNLKSVYYSRANTLKRLFSLISNQKDTIASTVLTVPGHGDEEKLRIKLDQFFRLDSRVLTGLSVSPTVRSTFDYNGIPDEPASILYVFVDGAAQGVELSYRPVGVSENNNYQSLTYQSIPLKQGFNRVRIDMSGRTQPVALYLRNNSDTTAQARIMATDAYRSTGQETKPYAPASANTAILGSQLQTYPTYIDSAENRTHFWQFVQDLREYAASAGQSQQAGDMTDIRLTRQDLSLSATDAANIAFSDVTAENAQKFIQDVSEINTNRLNLYDKFDGREGNGTDANAVNPLTVVLAGTKNVTDPSTMYAYTNYYHLPSRVVAHVLKGEPEAVYGWANAHEYGHVVDNNTLVQPEITNNLYSLISSLELLKMHQQSQTNVKELNISQDFHPSMAQARDRIDAMLLNHMQGGTQTEGTYDQGDWFLKTLTMYEIMAYISTLSYDNYDYAANPNFSKEQAQEVKTYGVYGAALRLLRSGKSRAARMVGKNDATAKVNKLIALLSQATGYNVCPYFAARGFSAIQSNVQNYCGSFADLPEEAVMYSITAQAKQALHSVKPEAYPAFTSETTASAERDASGTMTVTLNNPALVDSVDFMDVYLSNTKIGFSRNLTYTSADAATPENSTKDYRFVVHDYAGNTVSATLKEKNEPENPDPGVSDPETPDPETPDPETPDPETPDPETPDPETPDPGTDEPSDTKPSLGIVDEKNQVVESVVQGGKVNLIAKGFKPSASVMFTLHSDPIKLGTVHADEHGVARLEAAIPANVPVGAHRVEAASGDDTVSVPLNVTARSSEPNEGSKDNENPTPGDNENPDNPKDTEEPDKNGKTDSNTGNTINSGNSDSSGDSKPTPDNPKDSKDNSNTSDTQSDTKHTALAKTGSTAPLMLLAMSLIGAFGSLIARRKRTKNN